MISVTITDRSGRTLSGQTVDAFWISIAPCAAVQRRHQLRARRPRHAAVFAELARIADLLYQLLSERRAAERLRPVRRAAGRHRRLLGEFAANGLVNIVGGCCGTTPEHIRGDRGGGDRGEHAASARLDASSALHAASRASRR